MAKIKSLPKVGRPTKYTEEYVDRILKYVKETDIPVVEEVALELDLDDDTIVEWAKKYPLFSAAYKKLKQKQRMALLKYSLNKEYATAGAIFQLKVNHNMIESEKRILAGDKNEPITFKWEGDENSDDTV